MIKIRLIGIHEEIEEAKKTLERDYDLVSVSKPYSVRESKNMSRIYIDAERRSTDVGKK